MKKSLCVLLAAAMMLSLMTAAIAEEKSSIDSFASRLKKASEKLEKQNAVTEQAEDDNSFGPALRINDPFYQKVRSSAYLQEDRYSKEANVMIEIKNVSGRTLYPAGASIVAYNAAGEVIDEETYSNYGPRMVENNESLFVWEWFYGLEVPISEIAYFEVKVESNTDSYTDYAKIEGQAFVNEGVAYTLIENTEESDIYAIQSVVAIENEEGTLLDICEVQTYDWVGIFPGSVMVLRTNVKDYAADTALMQGKAAAYVLHELD